VLTCVGDLVVRRRYWQCRCGHEGAYAADAVLGLDGHWSRTLQKHACRLTADVSFATAREHLQALLGVSTCAETLRTLSERHGRAMARFQPQDEASAQAFRQAEGQVEFTVDAGKVNTREESWKDLKIGVLQKRTAAEPVCAATWQEPRLPPPQTRLAFARIAPAAQFRRCWLRWLRRRGVEPFAEVQVLRMGRAGSGSPRSGC